MIVSLNEAEVMATKAANGAGRPWGLAQEAGRAVSMLEAQHLPGAACLLGLLRATDNAEADALAPDVAGDVWAAPDGAACPLLLGAYLSDLGGIGAPVQLRGVHAPLLMAPFLTGLSCMVRVTWARGSIVAGWGRVVAEGEVMTPVASDVQLVPLDGAGQRVTALPAAAPDVDIDDEIWEALGRFAHRTYVPATEASRLKGAGAGLTDND